MKAQALRRTLTLANVLLVLGTLAAGAWYMLKVRPAQADDAKRAAWVKPAMDAYQVASKNAAPAVVYPVLEKDLEAITRPDLTDVKGRNAPGVWPFVGPVPPPPRPKVESVKAPPPPTGLQALGRLLSVFTGKGPDERSVMLFEFTASKKKRAFAPGDRIDDKDADAGSSKDVVVAVGPKPRVPGLYLVSIDMAEPYPDPKFRIAYDIVAEGDGGTQRTEVVLSLKQAAATGTDVIRESAPAGVAGKGGTGSAAVAGARPAPSVAPNTPPPLDQVQIEVRQEQDQSRSVVFDDAAYDHFRYSDPDRLIADVKTEDAKDEKGDPKGVRLTGVPQGSLAGKFDVRPGDILKSINGKPVRSRAEAIDVVKGLPKDTTMVSVVIERDGRDILYNVDPRDPKTRSAAGKAKFR
ncbi:MAG TPA: PDZ domain-containing protein [Planctomycetota bacterium]|nr:PDZ domain-containing protein [Planctomycetota bacterium]